MEGALLIAIPPLLGFLMDLLIGDPERPPHPIRLFGLAIEKVESLLNRGSMRFAKGFLVGLFFPLGCFLFFFKLMELLEPSPWVHAGVASVFVFYGVSQRGLLQEGREVFRVLENEGLERGREQVGRIVGRDTQELSEKGVKLAVLESMAENLSDGVVAPLFFYAIGGVPGIMTYKMVNTLDSMLSYRSERFQRFGWASAKLDDLLNYIPARLTAFLMVLLSLSGKGLRSMIRYGRAHKSPNAGYPEAALAGILDCRFGGPHVYKGEWVEKPYIGSTDRAVAFADFRTAARLNMGVGLLVCISLALILPLFQMNMTLYG